MFYGIIVRMYCGKAEHNPPHVHVYYQKTKAVLDIRKCEIIGGSLPRRQARLVLAWAELHRDELLADWRLAINGEHPVEIEPLK
jgi:hypothetical protein